MIFVIPSPWVHAYHEILAMSRDTYIVRIPSADVPRDLKPEVESVLAELVPLVAARVKEKRQTDFKSLLDVLLGGVKLRTIDIRRAQMQAKALEAVLENSESEQPLRPSKSMEAGRKDLCRSVSGPRSISALWSRRSISARTRLGIYSETDWAGQSLEYRGLVRVHQCLAR
jgi:hypothetical protein